MYGKVDIGRDKPISFSFGTYKGDTYLTLYGGKKGEKIKFHVDVPDYDSPSNLARQPLPKVLKSAATAEAVVAGIVRQACSDSAYDPAGPINKARLFRENVIALAQASSFPNTPATVRLEKPIWPLGPQRTHAIWARRLTT